MSLCVSEGSQVSGLKAAWSVIAIVTKQLSTKLEEGIVGVDGTSNQAVIQQFPEHCQAYI